ncbi:MAG: hypothetical protein AAGN46_04030 [Acidobacteriota bacterium]
MSLKNIMMFAVGSVIGFFGLILLGGSFLGRDPEVSWLGHVVLATLLGLAPLCLGAWLIYASLRGSARRRRERREREVLALAERLGPHLEPHDVARETDLTLREAKRLLDDLHLEGHCRAEIGTDGTIRYAFSSAAERSPA